MTLEQILLDVRGIDKLVTRMKLYGVSRDEIISTAWLKIQGLDESKIVNKKAYVGTVLYNVCRTFYKRNKKHQVDHDTYQYDLTTNMGPDKNLIALHNKMEIERCLSTLSPLKRQVTEHGLAYGISEKWCKDNGVVYNTMKANYRHSMLKIKELNLDLWMVDYTMKVVSQLNDENND